MCPSKAHPSYIDQFSASIAKTVILPEAYKDFKDVFSAENFSYLPPHKDDYNVVNLLESKQFMNKFIYNLSGKIKFYSLSLY